MLSELEAVPYALSAEVMGIDRLTTLKDCIKQILVPKPNKLVFAFRDSRTVEKTWLDRSRCESWTDEMHK